MIEMIAYIKCGLLLSDKLAFFTAFSFRKI